MPNIEAAAEALASYYDEPVRVHYHIPSGKWSIAGKPDPTKAVWRVIRDAEGNQVFPTKLVLKDVKFIVNESGRQRAIREQKKNVHAWMEGTLVNFDMLDGVSRVPCGVGIKYNPYRRGEFYTTEYMQDWEIPIYQAKFVAAGNDTGVLAPEWALG